MDQVRNRSLEGQSNRPRAAAAFIGPSGDLGNIAVLLRLGRSQTSLYQHRSTSAELVHKVHGAGHRIGGGPCDTTGDLQCALE